MNHRDAYMSACTIILNQGDARHLDGMVMFLRLMGCTIEKADAERGVIECVGEDCVICELQHAKGEGERATSGFFGAVRKTATYIADYPVGDPRDKDGVEFQDDLEAV